jgi:hypothetical protein
MGNSFASSRSGAMNARCGIRIGSHVDLVRPPHPGRITLTNETVHHRDYTGVFCPCRLGKLSKDRAHNAHMKTGLSPTKTAITAGGRRRYQLPVLPLTGMFFDIHSE